MILDAPQSSLRARILGHIAVDHLLFPPLPINSTSGGENTKCPFAFIFSALDSSRVSSVRNRRAVSACSGKAIYSLSSSTDAGASRSDVSNGSSTISIGVSGVSFPRIHPHFQASILDRVAPLSSARTTLPSGAIDHCRTYPRTALHPQRRPADWRES
jgi:hypothetical protein